MVRSDTLDTVKFHVDLLSRAKLGDQNVGVNGLDGVVSDKVLLLTTNRMESDVLGVDVRIAVELARVRLALLSVRILGTFDIQAQDNGVVVAGGAATFRVVFRRLLEPAHPVDAFDRALKGDQTQARCEDFILNHRGVVVDEDKFNGEGWHFGHEDTAKGIRDGCIDADQGKCGFESLVAVEFDVKILLSHV